MIAVATSSQLLDRRRQTGRFKHLSRKADSLDQVLGFHQSGIQSLLRRQGTQ
ncbi:MULTISPECIES: hypothetical protein [Planktothricoides]|uniref:Transposase n=1 Tax=Planktothricoides raciborskii FACHB-1370 TaxID=2949576 RepID=A0ABR8EP00_9CYAN|nr:MULTISPECIES: hypothetical protein [Planktothricoides]MBD2547799.1 hypothetical protein [Planktothricoides raciborskii FACHB-1370]MBD2586228.1 hypothetical protein [Planktothricoides raciborskii FACHB-1261]